MKIRVVQSQHPRPGANASELGFGRYFADHMFLMEYSADRGWHDPRIVPYGAMDMDPANLTLHYGQTIFEGLKAYRWADGSVVIFRLEDHVDRFSRSASRLCMPVCDRQLLLDCFSALVYVDRDWVPSQPGTSLYLRPTMIAADNLLGVRPAQRYLMYLICSPVGTYYSKGASPVRIMVEERFSRVAPGGLGEAKTAANYAASLLAAEQAKQKGFDQVLWLDAAEHRWVEEVGTMNIFFVIDGVLVTPPLDGTILDGITRRSVLQLAEDWGIESQVRPVSMDELVEASERGKLDEAFGSGTAAVISPIGELYYKGSSIKVNERANSLRSRLFEAITDICYGRTEDTHGWIYRVKKPASEIIAEDFPESGASPMTTKAQNGAGSPAYQAINVP